MVLWFSPSLQFSTVITSRHRLAPQTCESFESFGAFCVWWEETHDGSTPGKKSRQNFILDMVHFTVFDGPVNKIRAD